MTDEAPKEMIDSGRGLHDPVPEKPVKHRKARKPRDQRPACESSLNQFEHQKRVYYPCSNPKHPPYGMLIYNHETDDMVYVAPFSENSDGTVNWVPDHSHTKTGKYFYAYRFVKIHKFLLDDFIIKLTDAKNEWLGGAGAVEDRLNVLREEHKETLLDKDLSGRKDPFLP